MLTLLALLEEEASRGEMEVLRFEENDEEEGQPTSDFLLDFEGAREGEGTEVEETRLRFWETDIELGKIKEGGIEAGGEEEGDGEYEGDRGEQDGEEGEHDEGVALATAMGEGKDETREEGDRAKDEDEDGYMHGQKIFRLPGVFFSIALKFATKFCAQMRRTNESRALPSPLSSAVTRPKSAVAVNPTKSCRLTSPSSTSTHCSIGCSMGSFQKVKCTLVSLKGRERSNVRLRASASHVSLIKMLVAVKRTESTLYGISLRTSDSSHVTRGVILTTVFVFRATIGGNEEVCMLTGRTIEEDVREG